MLQFFFFFLSFFLLLLTENHENWIFVQVALLITLRCRRRELRQYIRDRDDLASHLLPLHVGMLQLATLTKAASSADEKKAKLFTCWHAVTCYPYESGFVRSIFEARRKHTCGAVEPRCSVSRQ